MWGLFEWFFFFANDVQPEIKRFYFPARFAPDDAIHAQARGMLIDRFRVVEQRLAAGIPYYLGVRFSLADLTCACWATSVFPAAELFESCPYLAVHSEHVIAQHIVTHQESSFEYWRNKLQSLV